MIVFTISTLSFFGGIAVGFLILIALRFVHVIPSSLENASYFALLIFGVVGAIIGALGGKNFAKSPGLANIWSDNLVRTTTLLSLLGLICLATLTFALIAAMLHPPR